MVKKWLDYIEKQKRSNWKFFAKIAKFHCHGNKSKIEE